jgi:hypothetical protein
MAAPVLASVGAYLGPSTSSTANVAVPSGVAANDIILVTLHWENSAVPTPPSPFVQIDVEALVAPGYWNRVYWKRATGADSGTYNFTLNASDYRTAIAARFTGCITTGDPWDVFTNASSSSTSTTTPAVSLTTTGADRLLVWMADLWDTSTFTAPQSPQVYARPTNSWTSSRLLDICTRSQAAAGATGNVTGTLGIARERIAWLIALKPTAATSAPTVNAGADVTGHAPSTAFTRTATENSNGATITSRAWTISSGPAGVGTTIGTAAALSWTPTVAGSYVLQYAATNSVGTGTDTMSITVAVAPQPPGSVFDLTNWKLTTSFEDPSDPGDADEVLQPELNTYLDANFYLNGSNAMVMSTPVNGTTTSGSSATRYEFREMEAGWNMATSGYRRLTVSGIFDPTSIVGGSQPRQEIICGQIHGPSGTPPLYLSVEFTSGTGGTPVTPRLRVYKDGPGLANILSPLTSTTGITYRIEVANGRTKLWAAIGGVVDLPGAPQYDWAAAEFTEDTSVCYLKAGSYHKTTVASGSSGAAIVTITYLELLQGGAPPIVLASGFLPFFDS